MSSATKIGLGFHTDPRPPLATWTGLGQQSEPAAPVAELPPTRAALDSITLVDAVPRGSIPVVASALAVAAPAAAESRPELATLVDEGAWPAAAVELDQLTPWPGRPAPSEPGAVALGGPSADVAAHWPVPAAEARIPAPPPSDPDGTDLLPPLWTEPSSATPNETQRMKLDDPAYLDDGFGRVDVPADSPSSSVSIAPLTLSQPLEPSAPRRLRAVTTAAIAALLTAAAFLVVGTQRTGVRLEPALRAPAALVVWCPQGAVTPAASTSDPPAAVDAPSKETAAVAAPAEPQAMEPAPAARAPARARGVASKTTSQWLNQVAAKPAKKKPAKKRSSGKRRARAAR